MVPGGIEATGTAAEGAEVTDTAEFAMTNCAYDVVKSFVSRAAKDRVSLKDTPSTTWYRLDSIGGELLGVAGLLRLTGGGARIKGVWIKPDARGKACGTFLTLKLIDAAKMANMPHIEAYAYNEAFYVKHGFRRVGGRPNGAGRMVKTL